MSDKSDTPRTNAALDAYEKDREDDAFYRHIEGTMRAMERELAQARAELAERAAYAGGRADPQWELSAYAKLGALRDQMSNEEVVAVQDFLRAPDRGPEGVALGESPK